MVPCKEAIVQQKKILLDWLYLVTVPLDKSTNGIFLNGSLHGKTTCLFEPFDNTADGSFIQPCKEGQFLFGNVRNICLVVRAAFDGCSYINIDRFTVACLKRDDRFGYSGIIHR